MHAPKPTSAGMAARGGRIRSRRASSRYAVSGSSEMITRACASRSGPSQLERPGAMTALAAQHAAATTHASVARTVVLIGATLASGA